MPSIVVKECSRCHWPKNISHFNKDCTRRDGYFPWCRSCHNASKNASYDPDAAYFRHIKRKYGLSREDYAEMLAAQNGCCYICEIPSDNKRLYVDHCHSTGIVRGLLCHHCNTGIGNFEDDPKLLAAAIEYLNAKGLDTHATTTLEHSN